MKEIAIVKLAPGKVAFYDEYTKIHLTLSNPTAKIYEGMNLKRIKNSVKFGVLQVVVGSLATDVVTEVPVKTVIEDKLNTQKIEAHMAKENKDDEMKVINEEIVAKSDSIVTENANVEITETIKAETVADETKPKRGRKKASNIEINEEE